MSGDPARDDGHSHGRPLARLLAVLLAGMVVGAVAPGGALAAAQESDAALSLDVAPAEPTAAPGGSVNLTLTVENTGTERSVGPVARLETLPEGWTVVDQTSDNATYRSSTREWLWRGLDPGETGEATVAVAVPENAEGSHDLPVSADDAADATAETEVTVAVDASAPDRSDGEGSDAGDGGAGAIAGGTGGLPLLLGAGLAAVVAVAVGVLLRYRGQ